MSKTIEYFLDEVYPGKHFEYLHLSNRVRYFRRRLLMTQSELASSIGVSKNTISSIELGSFCPSSLTAYKLCVVLGCSFEELFFPAPVECLDF